QFSPDGTMLTICTSGGSGLVLTTIDVASGDFESRFVVPADLDTKAWTVSALGRPQFLQWLPDNSGWIPKDGSMIDRETGWMIWKLSPETFQGRIERIPLLVVAPTGLWQIEMRGGRSHIVTIPSPWSAARNLIADLA